MTLKDYIAANELRPADLAKALGISHSYASRLASGDRASASPDLAMKIEAWTDGQVPAASVNHVVATIQAASRNAAA